MTRHRTQTQRTVVAIIGQAVVDFGAERDSASAETHTAQNGDTKARVARMGVRIIKGAASINVLCRGKCTCAAEGCREEEGFHWVVPDFNELL